MAQLALGRCDEMNDLIAIERKLLRELVEAAKHPQYPIGDPPCVVEGLVALAKCQVCQGAKWTLQPLGAPTPWIVTAEAGYRRCVACNGTGQRGESETQVPKC